MGNLISLGRRSDSTLVELIFLFLTVQTLTVGKAVAQDDPLPRKNLEIIQAQIGALASEVVERSKLGKDRHVYVRILTSENSWVVQNSVLEALKRLSYDLFVASFDQKIPGATVEVSLVEATVIYGPAFRESLFGRQRSQRTIKTTLSASVRSPAEEVLFAGNLSRVYSDTVYTGNLDELESPGIQYTHGEPPREGFFDNILEPAILLGATAVAIYLFFTVRS